MIRRLAKRLLSDLRGTLSVEMAIAMPILFALMLSGVEVTRYVLLNQKVERATATMADLVAQSRGLAEGDLDNLFAATGFVMAPFEIGANGLMVVSSIAASGGAAPRVLWQRTFGGGGGGSTFGTEGSDAVLPAGFLVRDNENIITTEIFYDYEPAFTGTVMAPVELHNFAIFRPRFVNLTSIDP
ncbi:MAG: pilus assembly protein [Rhodospirillales bacterium]|nr:pilus assembly protein [Rhodospirillales bacterium]